MKHLISKYRFYKLLVVRCYEYGIRYYYDEEYRNICIKKRKNQKLKERRIRKYGQAGLNRYFNFNNSVKKRILKDNPYGRCEQCIVWKERKEITVDHIIPISQGGKMIKENVQLLCKDCHQKKSLSENPNHYSYSL
jgi:5-methylcytosine-specific restriction endonuclease McrA